MAVRGTEIVGFTSYGAARGEERIGELYTIYVLPDTWGLGVGRVLMRETLAGLRAHDYTQAVLWVLEDNPRTRRFYERAGWHADGGVLDGEWLGTVAREVRYRIDLESAGGRHEGPE